MNIIDLRSDTVTKPSREMLEYMMKAETGDDVFGEDPTVNRLENKMAEMFGQESALFCPSGTMTNQIAIKVHTRPGDEVIAEATAHVYLYETGGMASNAGVQAKLIHGKKGIVSASQVEDAINPGFDWFAKTKLVCIENSANRAGGSVYNYDEILRIERVCKKNNLGFHMDGARIFNALTVTGQQPSEIGKNFDSISVCLSKGLGAPAGSVLIGSRGFITEARRVRKSMGGGMRQAGILAAAGIFAVEYNVKLLQEDHRRARIIEKTLNEVDYVESVIPVETNIIIFNLKPDFSVESFASKLKQAGIVIAPFGKQTVRLVTHLDFNDAMLGKTVETLKELKG